MIALARKIMDGGYVTPTKSSLHSYFAFATLCAKLNLVWYVRILTILLLNPMPE